MASRSDRGIDDDLSRLWIEPVQDFVGQDWHVQWHGEWLVVSGEWWVVSGAWCVVRGEWLVVSGGFSPGGAVVNSQGREPLGRRRGAG